MDVIKGMTVFIEVAKQRGFAPAARRLHLSTSAVSRYVIDLENWLGAQLLQRTTRKLSLTEAGGTYLERCERLIEEVRSMQEAADATNTAPHGRLRVTAPVFIAKYCLQDMLPGFLNRYPDVDLELVVTDRFVDLIEEGFDVAIRAGALKDSSLTSSRLFSARVLVTAAPSYLELRGTPKKATDLKDHNCLVDTVTNYLNRWPVADKKGARPITVRGNLRVNSGEIIRSMTVAGIGISLLPEFMTYEDIREGRLVVLLSSEIQREADVFCVYPHRRFLSTNIQAFVDHVVEYVHQLDGSSLL